MSMHVLDQITARAHNTWFALRDGESGQTLIEYVLIITLIPVAAIVSLGFLSGRIQALFSNAGSSLPT